VLGEYGTVEGAAAGDVMDQLCSVCEAQSVGDTVRGYMLSAFCKLAVHGGGGLTPAAREIQHAASLSSNPDLQLRALELDAILRSPPSSPSSPCALLLSGDPTHEALGFDGEMDWQTEGFAWPTMAYHWKTASWLSDNSGKTREEARVM